MITELLTYSLDELRFLCQELNLVESGHRLALVLRINSHSKRSDLKSLDNVSSSEANKISTYDKQIADLELEVYNANFPEFLSSKILKNSDCLKCSSISSGCDAASINKNVARTDVPFVTIASSNELLEVQKQTIYDFNNSYLLLPPPMFRGLDTDTGFDENSLSHNSKRIKGSDNVPYTDNFTDLNANIIPIPLGFKSITSENKDTYSTDIHECVNFSDVSVKYDTLVLVSYVGSNANAVSDGLTFRCRTRAYFGIIYAEAKPLYMFWENSRKLYTCQHFHEVTPKRKKY